MDVAEPQGIHCCYHPFREGWQADVHPVRFVEVAESHSGVNLAVAFAKVLDDFGISKKVSNLRTFIIRKQINSLILPHPSVRASPVTTRLPTIP